MLHDREVDWSNEVFVVPSLTLLDFELVAYFMGKQVRDSNDGYQNHYDLENTVVTIGYANQKVVHKATKVKK
jgi:hypothetical protein